MGRLTAESVDPATLAGASAPELDEFLGELEARVPTAPTLSRVAPPGATDAIVVGDTHGDWRSTVEAARWFLERPRERAFVGLGDYVDRSPADCPRGSVVNALYLLSLRARFPDRVVLVLGNHEGVRWLPVEPHSLPEELSDGWGPNPGRYDRLLGLLERGPLAAYTGSGVFLAHGGFPRRGSTPWESRFDTRDPELLGDLLWRDPTRAAMDRGVSPAFDEAELARFLGSAHLAVFLRGHDPDLTGRPIFGRRCLTLHTTRVYARFGGVIAARLPLDRPVRSTDDLTVVHLATERTVAAALRS